MRIPFYKYQATSNDFIIINQTVVPYLKNPEKERIAQWCDRRLGIGADGLMLINPSEEADFEMVYYNSDGRVSTMCGNGGRAISHLAHALKIMGKEGCFIAIDGIHEVKIGQEVIHLKMSDVPQVNQRGQDFVLNTGSPHYVKFRSEVEEINLLSESRSIRYSDEYKDDGINVNFVDARTEGLHVRTYERGVEDETFSCGTGVVAAAIAHSMQQDFSDGSHLVNILTKGGNLKIQFNKSSKQYSNIWLIGPTSKVFEGAIEY